MEVQVLSSTLGFILNKKHGELLFANINNGENTFSIMPFKDEEKRKASHAAAKRKIYQRNREYILSKKSKCSNCGYDKCQEALEFHHLDPSEKDFDSAKMKSLSIQKIQEEIDKCVVLCANCHRETHFLGN